MTPTILAAAIVLAGFALSRARLVRELNSKRFMPFVYAAATIYFAVRAWVAASEHARVWPHVILGIMFLAGVIESARASGIFRRS